MQKPHHPRLRALFSLAVLLCLYPLAACSDDGTELEEVIVDIDGDWILEASLDQDQGGPLTCELEGVTLQIDMQGNTRLFGGNTAGGTLSCSDGGQNGDEPLPELQIATGIQSMGSEITFDLVEGDNFLGFEGALGTGTISGDVQGLLVADVLGAGVVAMVGTFTATRS